MSTVLLYDGNDNPIGRAEEIVAGAVAADAHKHGKKVDALSIEQAKSHPALLKDYDNALILKTDGSSQGQEFAGIKTDYFTITGEGENLRSSRDATPTAPDWDKIIDGTVSKRGDGAIYQDDNNRVVSTNRDMATVAQKFKGDVAALTMSPRVLDVLDPAERDRALKEAISYLNGAKDRDGNVVRTGLIENLEKNDLPGHEHTAKNKLHAMVPESIRQTLSSHGIAGGEAHVVASQTVANVQQRQSGGLSA